MGRKPTFFISGARVRAPWIAEMKGTRHEELLDTLRELARSVAADAGVELVELTLRGPSGNRALRVDIDRPGARGVGLDDCQHVSAALGQALEAADVIDGRYVLEVSSPGADRPIRSEADGRRNTGRRVLVTTREPTGGRRRFVGVLLAWSAGWVRIDDDEAGEVSLRVDDVESAHQDLGF